ncbi:serine/threonine-protein kinase Nek9-like isoform X2 [Mya arenaria]|uniref:serine/threonine-protein kinase Nek9-like isoform X2 n=1 Tax=Mya arenaria TaxID=6604 RepID=UPI0022E91CFA|nr:serine/threonine-protein kinase Nek9-like isoform X2 [Mya arenaria]
MARLGEKECRDANNEIDILFLLNHANIVTYYNHFMDGSTLLIELEYANGGTLSDKIDQQEQPFEEEVVKWYLFQLASALAHCHENGIIHRDVKCLNIFMTKSDLLKLGDFGISKVLESKSQQAETVVGTPLYMSPELMKGDKYDYKTDVWSLGCVLSELLTLSRTFLGTNKLQLAYEIVCGTPISIDAAYSPEIRKLVEKMLKKEQRSRPTAQEIIDSDVLKERLVYERRVYELNTGSRRARILTSVSVSEQTVVPVVKSKVTEVYQWGGGRMTPQKQDIFVKGRSAAQVSAGHSHFAVVTMEKELYTWANVQGGSKIVGQLGHGNTASYKTPKKVEAFEGVGIVQAECGEDFTVCLTDEGQVYTFGSNFYGCLGMETDSDEVTSPVCVETFANLPVQEIICGDNHVVALTKNGDVYTWGCGEFGRLGQGSEDDCTVPQKVSFPSTHHIKHVYAGSESTFLLTQSGRVLAAGSNEHNKLGFNANIYGIKKHKPKVYDIPCKLHFALVRPLMRLNVQTIAAGNNHSAVIDICGHLHTFGCNKNGQLGSGDFKSHSGICRVSNALANHRVEKVTCGDGFTVASTSDNYVYAWGDGENGRLGFGPIELGKGPNKKSVSLPRPIFGSLHIVPHLSARHWHTILIAEKVLNEKTLRTRCSMPKMKLLQQAKKVENRNEEEHREAAPNTDSKTIVNFSAGQEDSAFSDLSPVYQQTGSDITSSLLSGDSGKPNSPDGSLPFSSMPKASNSLHLGLPWAKTESDLPPWLEAELEDEVIPIPAGFVIQSPGIINPYANQNDSKNVGPNGFQWQPPSSSETGFTPTQCNSYQSSSQSSVSQGSWKKSSTSSSSSSKRNSTGVFQQQNGGTDKSSSSLSSQDIKALSQTLETKELTINQLAHKVKELELENMKIRDHYEEVIKGLNSKIATLQDQAKKE